MKRTEDVFEIRSGLRLLKADDTVQVFFEDEFISNIRESLSDLIAALQQFQKTGTFVKPPKWTVEKTVTTPPSYFVENKHEALGVRCSATYLKTRYAAQRIADILNEEEE